MKNKPTLVVLFLLSLWSFRISAQCPASINITGTAVGTATCPSNGSFSITATVGTGATYQITAGPAGYPSSPQSTNAFAGLLPGNYTVKVACAGDPSVFATTSITIPSSYIHVAASSVTSNVCTGSIPGGTITTTVTAGSSATYSYAYWQGDPGIADMSLTYQVNNTSSLTNSFSATAFGIYNVRVKDACGVFVTQQVAVSRTYPENFCINNGYMTFSGITCAQLVDSINVLISFSNVSVLPPQGYDVEVYENTSDCNTPVRGPLAKKIHLDQSAGNSPIITVPNFKNLLFVTKTPCGDSCTWCYLYDVNSQHMNLNVSIISDDCAAAGDPIDYSITIAGGSNYLFPITIIIKNSAGVQVPGSPYVATTDADLVHKFTNLPADTYTVSATDLCGRPFNYTLTPASGPPNKLHFTYTGESIGCSSIEGRTYFIIYTDGVMANLNNAVATVIPPSPNLIGTTGFSKGGGIYDWINAIPGATYYIEINNGCGQRDTLSLTIPVNAPVLNQHTTASVEQLCGGLGNITVAATYNGYGTFSYDVKNSSGIIIGTGTTPGGTYSNLPAGVYTINSHIIGCGPYNYSTSVTILPGGSGPVITKKSGITCEDGSGSPTTTGNALLSFTGAQPFKVDYRLSSGTDADYINVTNSSTGIATITSLVADSSYTTRITDNCGNAIVSQLQIGVLAPIGTENFLQPCVGAPYILSVPDMIDATYAWKKAGITISTQRSISFSSFTAGDNGTYVCDIVIAGCVQRSVTVTLNSLLCGNLIVLPVKLSSFTAKSQNCSVILNWKTPQGFDSKDFAVQRSINGADFITVSNSLQGGSDSYNYIDNNLLQGNIYYRLMMVDKDGHHQFSNILIVNARCNSIKTQWSVYPSLVQPGGSVTVRLNTADAGLSTVSIVVTGITGQRAFTYDVPVHQGQNIYIMPDKKLVPGTYLLCVYDKQLLRIGGVQKLIYSR